MSAKVFDELICPECGGRIGAELTSGSKMPGLKPCSCFAPQPPRKRPLPDEPDPVDLAPNIGSSAASGKKLCRVCGKDLAGRSRLKDEKGYICKKCSDAEFAAEAQAEKDAIECPECHRKLKPEAFVEWRGTLICRRCQVDHRENDKLKVAKLGDLKKHDEHEKQSLVRLAVIVGAALVLALLVKTVFIGW